VHSSPVWCLLTAVVVDGVCFFNLLLQLAALEGDKTHLMHERGAVVREQTRITGTGNETAQAAHVAASEVLMPQIACFCNCVECHQRAALLLPQPVLA
jgi:hypothetical protein